MAPFAQNGLCLGFKLDITLIVSVESSVNLFINNFCATFAL